MEYTQPEKYCKRGHLIPDNRQLLEPWDQACQKARAEGLPEPPKPRIKGPQLICKVCAEAESIGLPQRQRFDRHHEDQTVIDVPMMRIS